MLNYENYSKILEEKGIRASSHRVLMLEYLENKRIHPTAERIYNDLSKKLPSISKATVYNNLKLFVDNGILNELNVDNTEAHYDIVTKNHAHFICENCKEIYDFDLDFDKIFSHAEYMKDFKVFSKDIIVRGICKNCLDKSTN